MKSKVDLILEELEKDLKKEYGKALKEIKEQINNFKFSNSDDARQRLIEANKYNRLKSLETQIQDTINNADKEAVKIINSKMVNVYQTSYNDEMNTFINKEVVKNLLTKEFDPFGKIALDKLKYGEQTRSQLVSELTTGIIKGESNQDIASRIQKVTEKNYNDSIKIARTETTRVENTAKLDVGEHLEKKGFKIMKEWVATSDDRTRPWHNEANGQIVGLHEDFKVGGERMECPGDPAASAMNVINCRCTIKNIIVEN